jgi:DivIVA domain-containing protein
MTLLLALSVTVGTLPRRGAGARDGPSWWDRAVGTALIYLLVVVAVAAAVFGLAAAVFGRGEELAPLPPDATPTRLPVGDVAGDDIRELRFPQAVRGYRMADVDWVLERLADELDRTTAERDSLRARVEELEGPELNGRRAPAEEDA